MPLLRVVTVFCGSNSGDDPRFVEAAKTLGKCLADQNIELIYGGGMVGLMGALSQAVIDNGGKVTGFVPEFLLEADPRYQEATFDIVAVEDMHTVKRNMLAKGDAFIAMPGGFGTADELLEMITGIEWGLHHKPIGILNVAGYYDKLLEWVLHGIKSGFIAKLGDRLPYSSEIWSVTDDPEELLSQLSSFPLITTQKSKVQSTDN